MFKTVDSQGCEYRLVDLFYVTSRFAEDVVASCWFGREL